jgi:calcium/calmodulin-dependent protein kinase-4
MGFLCCFRGRARANKMNDIVQRKVHKDETAQQFTAASKVFKKYSFLHLIGEGGTAEVWEAMDKITGEMVAIKVAKTTFDARYMANEYSIMKDIDCPNVTKPMYFFDSGTISFMVMKRYFSSLFEIIVSQPITEESLKHVVREIALGLKSIHDAGYVHRDIKPENILVDKDGYVVITDFGATEKCDRVTVERPLGTGSYLAPEVVESIARPDRGLFTVGKPVDIYALGQVIYTCITHENAIPHSSNSQDIIHNNYEFDMTPFINKLNVCTDLKDLLYRTTARNPVSRMTIDELLEHPFLA